MVVHDDPRTRLDRMTWLDVGVSWIENKIKVETKKEERRSTETKKENEKEELIRACLTARLNIKIEMIHSRL